MNVLNSLSNAVNFVSSRVLTSSAGAIRLLETTAEALDIAGNNKNEVAAVIVSIVGGNSYDQLFRSVPQSSDMGIIYTYEVKAGGKILRNILKLLKTGTLSVEECTNEEELNTLLTMRDNCETAGHDAVCFNFECCSDYSSHYFCSDNSSQQAHLALTAFLVLEFGALTMFSDFSLKALINQWDESKLGPNPFVNVGEFSGALRLLFDCEELKNCPSAQLESLGKLSKCEEGTNKGTANVHAMGGTIAYTVKKQPSMMNRLSMTLKRKKAPLYELEVLTIIDFLESDSQTSKLKNAAKPNLCNLKNNKIRENGLAGHVILTYPPIPRPKSKVDDKVDEEPLRGRILTSCGHWAELMRIDTNMDRLLQHARDEYGPNTAKYTSWENDLTSATEEERVGMVNKLSHNLVQSRSPMKYNKVLMTKKAITKEN